MSISGPPATHAVFLVSALLLSPGQAAAGPVSITNPGFEDQVLLDGHSTGSILGWAQAGGGFSGTLNPTPANYTAGLTPEGNNVAFSGGLGRVASQVLAATLQAGTRYTLTMYVGDRLNQSSFGGYRIELLAGGNVLAFDQNTVTPAKGAFALVTVTYDALAANPNLGQPLEIRFRHTVTSGVNYTDFDDFRLDASPIAGAVPEPASLTLLVTGVGALMAARWRRGCDLAGRSGPCRG